MITQPNYLKDLPTSKTGWFKEYCQTHWRTFLNAGLPKSSCERWKYVDFSLLSKKQFGLAKENNCAKDIAKTIDNYRIKHSNSFLITFVNGYFAPQFSDYEKIPSQVQIVSLNAVLSQTSADGRSLNSSDRLPENWPASINAEAYPFACLNAAMLIDGILFVVADHYELKDPIHLLSIATDHDTIAHPHHYIFLGEGSKLTLVEEYIAFDASAYFTNTAMHMHLSQDAKLQHYKIQQEAYDAIHMSYRAMTQCRNSHANLTTISLGSQCACDDLIVALQEPGASCSTQAFYHCSRDKQYLDHHVMIKHLAENTTSEMLYKGIIDKKSKAVFKGSVYVEKDAQNIQAHQSNAHLLLSKEAEAYARPELEIYADNVICKHGASTGQVDEDALFYLCSRGLDQETAVKIILQGFAEEVLQRIPQPSIQLHVQERMGSL